MLVRGVPASLESENTRPKGCLRSGLISLDAAEGTVFDLDAVIGNSDRDGVAVVLDSGLNGADSSLGVSSLMSCGGAGDAVGDGGNLKLEGGIFEIVGIRPEVVRDWDKRGVVGTPLPTEACRACEVGCD